MTEPAEVASTQVRAAGGVVWRRRGSSGVVEVLVVHRPRYDDWSFPKGKCDPGESFAQTAERELREETGFDVAFGPFLDDVYYRDHKDRTKVVRYWAMTIVDGSFEPNDEVDEIRWVPVAEAATVLSYDHDADLLGRLAAAL